ncbi:hypothetical protein CKO39_18130 [Rhodopseudomonas palustris]|nr:hypothetical protein CKO39_18130 [Rhodopseudomonas palustris]
MKTLIAAVIFAIGIQSTASAWHLSSYRDKMSDRRETSALVIDGDATLYVGCMNGQPQARLRWLQRIGYGSDLGITYRFGQGPIVPRTAMLSQDGKDIWPWLGDPGEAIASLRNTNRLRVQIRGTVLDFDLTQGGSKLPEWSVANRDHQTSSGTARVSSDAPTPSAYRPGMLHLHLFGSVDSIPLTPAPS